MANPQVISSRDSLSQLQAKVRADVRQLAGVTADENAVAESHFESFSSKRTTTGRNRSRSKASRASSCAVFSEPRNRQYSSGYRLDGSRRPLKRFRKAPSSSAWCAREILVIAFHPRDVLGEPQSGPEQLALGQYMPELLRAIVVGKTIVGMRVDDVIRVVNWSATRNDVDRPRYPSMEKAAWGWWHFMRPRSMQRIGRVILESSLLSYRTALEAGLHKNLSESRHPRRADSIRHAAAHASHFSAAHLPDQPGERDGARAQKSIRSRSAINNFATDRALGQPDRIKLFHRGFGDPLPFE